MRGQLIKKWFMAVWPRAPSNCWDACTDAKSWDSVKKTLRYLSACRCFLSACRSFLSVSRCFLSVCRNFLSACRNVLSVCRCFLSVCRCFLSACRNFLSVCRCFLSACKWFLSACRNVLSACRNFLSVCTCFLSACKLFLSACRNFLSACRSFLSVCRCFLSACRFFFDRVFVDNFWVFVDVHQIRTHYTHSCDELAFVIHHGERLPWSQCPVRAFPVWIFYPLIWKIDQINTAAAHVCASVGLQPWCVPLW